MGKGLYAHIEMEFDYDFGCPRITISEPLTTLVLNYPTAKWFYERYNKLCAEHTIFRSVDDLMEQNMDMVANMNLSKRGMGAAVKGSGMNGKDVYNIIVTVCLGPDKLVQETYNIIAGSFEEALRNFAQFRPQARINKVELIDGVLLT